MGKKFLSVILSVLMFACPLSIFAAETNQFEEVCNFYDYANKELISSNSDKTFDAASEKFSKYYNKAVEYIKEHPNDFDPESDIGKIVQAESYFNLPENADEGTYIDPDNEDSWITVSGLLDDYDFHLIKSTLFLKQTLLYLKEKNTDVFGTDNIEELNKLGDAVAYLEENLPEIIYSIEESLIEYIKSLPLSNVVKEDMEREILKHK